MLRQCLTRNLKSECKTKLNLTSQTYSWNLASSTKTIHQQPKPTTTTTVQRTHCTTNHLATKTVVEKFFPLPHPSRFPKNFLRSPVFPCQKRPRFFVCQRQPSIPVPEKPLAPYDSTILYRDFCGRNSGWGNIPHPHPKVKGNILHLETPERNGTLYEHGFWEAHSQKTHGTMKWSGII